EEAHNISGNVEKNIKNTIANSKVTVHFEPTWKDIPVDYVINNVSSAVKGVEGIHNINSSTAKEGLFISLHVMVDRNMSLEDAHKVSDEIENQIRKSVSNVNHITIHLEPYVSIPKSIPVEDLTIEEQVANIIKEYPKVKKIGRVITFQLQDIFKVDIDCSFEKNLTVEEVHDIVSEIENKIKNKIRKTGISSMKIDYIKDLARNIEDGKLKIKSLTKMSDEQVIEQLTQIKGIGRWTAEMFLIFSLGRQDVLPVHDLGLRKAMQFAFSLPQLPKPKEVEKLGERWKPYRSIATWYLWKSLQKFDRIGCSYLLG